MNLEQVRNPHLIFPGQVLFLDKSNGRAPPAHGRAGRRRRRRRPVAARPLARHRDRRHRLDPVQPDRAVPQRSGDLRDQRARRPRRASSRRRRAACCCRAATPPTSAATSAPSASTASSASRGRCATRRPRKCSATRRPTSARPSTRVQGETRTDADGKAEIIPATFTVTSIRQEAGVGDRLAPVPAREYTNYAPHAPAGADRRPDRLDLRRRPDRRARTRSSPSTRAPSTASSAATCSRSGATARSSSTRPTDGAHEDQAARRAPRRAVRVPRLRPRCRTR